MNGFVFAESIFWGSTTAGKLIPLNREWFCIWRSDYQGINKRSAVNPDQGEWFIFAGVTSRDMQSQIKRVNPKLMFLFWRKSKSRSALVLYLQE